MPAAPYRQKPIFDIGPRYVDVVNEIFEVRRATPFEVRTQRAG